jgi:hypothetical protein
VDGVAPDVRNTLTKAFEDCLNSGDPDCVKQVLCPIVDEHCVVESYALKQLGLVGSEELENLIEGKRQVVPYFMGYVVAIPDMVFLVHEWKLFQRGGGVSCLMFKFTLSGTQIVAHDTKCNIVDDADAATDAATDAVSPVSHDADEVVGQKRGHGSEDPDSVRFKATTHQGRQDRRQKKQKTLGEFVTDNRVYDKHIAATVDVLVQDAAAVPLPHDAQLVELPPGVASAAAPEAAARTKEALGLQAAAKITMKGVMRFHFNERNQIFKIHCVHFTSH